MGLDDVLEDVQQRGQRRAEEIRQEADEEAEAILEEAEREAEQTIEQAKDQALADAEPLRRQALLSAEIEAKKQRLEAEREAMDEVRERAREILGDLPEDRRLELIEALVARVTSDLDDPRIYAAEPDADLVQKVAPERFEGTEEIWGGVVAESADGQVRVDYSFETLLDEVWDDHVDEVSGILRE